MSDLLERHGWLGGVSGLLFFVAAVLVTRWEGGDFREGGVPLLVALTAASWLACLAAAAYAHSDRDNWLVWIGFGWAGLGLGGWIFGWGLIWVGDLLRWNGQRWSLGDWAIFLSIGLGTLAIIAGLAVFGAGAVGAGVLPWWGRIIPIVMAVSLPLAVILDRVLEGSRSIRYLGVGFGVFAIGWLVLGGASRSRRTTVP